jgi:hypothetical protein
MHGGTDAEALAFPEEAARLTVLLYGYRLGGVARLVYVAASADGDVVGEQLQRDDFEDRQS